ncbi:MAG: glycoside hydrolase family 2 protein, partial [Clostridiales bacterium]|nr:glycoside hydrolase family 2 protein [Clostridiales bacterium]
MKRQSLCGKWEFRQPGKRDWFKATVPGSNYLDLLEIGKIPDPFDGMNESLVKWVGEVDWEYKKLFTVSDADLCAHRILLVCKTLDTICDVLLNGELIGKGENCHTEYRFDIGGKLLPGENELRIVFYSPVNSVSEIHNRESAPMNNNGQYGIVHIRKPQYHFGWDWGPVLPPSGISGDIYIEYESVAVLDDIKITQEHINGTVRICANADIATLADAGTECEISLICPDSSVLTQKGDRAEFIVENPELWWTYELSSKDVQPLYTVKAVLTSGGMIVDEIQKKIGLRTIELNRGRDEYGTNFQFILNGVPLFIKGANYIPPDSFVTRYTADKLKRDMDAARYSNMNMLRVWGGGYYESDAFYDACDLYGILVWQDFCFACQAYPFFKEDFLENVKNEVACVVKRLSHHASLALWNGNNEIEDMHLAWLNMKNYIEWTEIFFYTILEPEIRKYDTSTAYIPGSPCGVSHNKGVSSDNVGDTHLWNVWHGLQPMNYYRKRMTRFCSEYGFESLPDMKTIKHFAKPEDYSLSGEVFTAHQKCTSGNNKMIFYISSRFRLPERFEDYVYLSQVTQKECISDATEHWRRNKGRCNGSMYWQFNDCWPVCSWAGMDYYGNYKALQYCARDFNAPVSVSLEDTKDYVKIFAINDLNQNLELEIEYEIFDFSKGKLEEARKSIDVRALENVEVFSLDVRSLKAKYNPKTTGICAKLCRDNQVLMQKTVLFDMEKRLSLPRATPVLDVKIEGDTLRIDVVSDKFARLVRIDSSLSSLPFSENFFDLLPGQKKTVTQKLDSKFSPEELAKSISVFSCSDIVPTKNRTDEHLVRFKLFSSPK